MAGSMSVTGCQKGIVQMHHSQAQQKHQVSAAADALYTQMRAAIRPWVALAEPQWRMLKAICYPRMVRNQEHVVYPGTHSHELFFVASGLLRFYYLGENGSESNKAFIIENQFAGSLAAFTLDLPVLYGVQALEPTTMLVASYADVVALYDQHSAFDRFGRKLAEWLLLGKEIRNRSFLQHGAAERYQEFVRHYPHLVQRLPQYHIASYLGITEVSLSRLKRQLVPQLQV
jgi:CRP-like cAMP-binding protein